MDEKERIIKVMESEGVNATQFALEIGIQGPTLSHVLNGRNKPSLEVLKKILNRYRTISSDWLILGIGAMYRSTSHSQQPSLFDIKPEIPEESDSYVQNFPAINASVLQQSSVREKNSLQQDVISPTSPPKVVTKVVVFYTDGTFEEICK